MNIFISIFIHHFFEILLLIILVIASYLWRRYIVSLYYYIVSIPRKIEQKFHFDDSRYISNQIMEEKKQNEKIRKDILNCVKNLESNSTNEQEVAIEYLLNFPSPEGVIAISKLAVNLNTTEARIKLMGQLYRSLKSNKWYA